MCFLGWAHPTFIDIRDIREENQVKIIYTPKDGESHEFTFTPDDLSAMEAEAIEEAGGVQWRAYGQWVELLAAGGARAWRVALWVLLRRTNPKLDLNEVQPSFREVQYFYDDRDAEREPGKDEPDATPTDSPSPEPASEASPSNSDGT